MTSSVKCQFTGELFALFSLWQAKKLQDDKMHLSFFFCVVATQKNMETLSNFCFFPGTVTGQSCGNLCSLRTQEIYNTGTINYMLKEKLVKAQFGRRRPP